MKLGVAMLCGVGIMISAGCKRDRVEYYEYDEDDTQPVVIQEQPVVVHETHVHQPPVVVHEQPVIVERTHVHSRDCGCCWDNGNWVVVAREHRHGPGCGHVIDGNYWVVARTRPVEHKHPSPPNYRPRPPRPHTHSASCGCVYDRGRWLIIKGGHHHQRGCGHVYVNGRWCVAR